KDCPLYTAKIIKGVKVGPSPAWLKERLELIGCRSINNIVDITNYVLFEQGQPLHAFDLGKLALNISIRRARRQEEIITIDGIKRALDEKTLVIASGPNGPADQPIAIAGVMGGKDTEVTEKTKDILLEAAVFNPITVRHGRQRLGLQSDSAYRFERGVDLEAVEFSSWRAAELIRALAQGECILAKSSGRVKAKKKLVSLNLAQANKILGTDIAPARIKKILGSLGFKTAPKGRDCLMVGIPAYRQDVTAEIDLVEEVARIQGFDKMPTTLPLLAPKLIPGGERELVSALKNILAGLGLNEVITYSLIDRELLKDFMPPDESVPVEVLNPLSREQGILRPSLVPSIAACIAYNLNHQQEYVNIFEVAKVFSSSASGPKEEPALGIALCGTKSRLLQEGAVREKFGLLHLKGILEVLFERLGVKNYTFCSKDNPSLIGISAGRQRIGKIFILGKDFLERLDIKNKEVVAAEIYLEKLFFSAKPAKNFSALPRYPGITRDISVVLPTDLPIEEVLEAAQDAGRPFLCEIKVADFYKGSQIPQGFIGLTISCLYRCSERTLSDKEVNPVHSLLCRLLEEGFGAKIRQG
ncbi:MAG: phenylalanine--tRNA ligase subunit beta, partial [Candidatus Omnitrophota bacterium]